MSRLDELDVVIRRKGARIVAGIPAVSLYASGEDAAAALAALDVRKKAYEADLAEAGLSDSLVIENVAVAGVPAAARPVRGELAMVAIKAVIVVGVIAAAVVIVGGLAAAKVDELSVKLAPIMQAKIGGPQFWSKLEDSLDRAAAPDNTLPPAKQEKLLSNLRIIVGRVRPFVAEVAPLFSDSKATEIRSGTQTCN